MSGTFITKDGSKSPAACLIVALPCFPISVVVLELWRADWRVPFNDGGDALFCRMLIKGVSDTGWILHNDFIGMPWGADPHDFPQPDVWHRLVIKLVVSLASDHVPAMNLFFAATFPLATLMALFVFRRFGVRRFGEIQL